MVLAAGRRQLGQWKLQQHPSPGVDECHPEHRHRPHHVDVAVEEPMGLADEAQEETHDYVHVLPRNIVSFHSACPGE